MSAVRTAVVGVGRLGAEHARILSVLPGSRLVGVHDRRPSRAEAVARRVGGATRAFRRLEPLLQEVEAVVVAVPTRAHHAVGRAVLEAGCHLLVEKPLAATLDEAEGLTGAAGSRDLLLCVGRIERFNPAVRGGIGYVRRPRFMLAERLSPFRHRGTDVGVVLDLMIHDLDLVLSMAEAPVRATDAVGVSVLTDSVDLANARLEFGDGAVAQVTASRVSTSRARRLRVFQESGQLSLDLASGDGEFLHGSSPGIPVKPDAGIDDASELEAVGGEGPEPLRLELEGFLREVRGEGGETVTGREALPALELALRITREIEESSHVLA